MQGQCTQVSKHAIDKQLQVEACATNHIRWWMCVLKQIWKRTENMMWMTFGVIFELDEWIFNNMHIID